MGGSVGGGGSAGCPSAVAAAAGEMMLWINVTAKILLIIYHFLSPGHGIVLIVMFRPRKDRIINAIRPLFPAVGPQLQRPSRAWHVAPDRLAIGGWLDGCYVN